MIISFCFCVFAVLINKVCLQITVEAVIDGSVVLPCSSTQHDRKLQDINVHWRHNNREIVYDIISGKDSVELQVQRYKSRAKTFPDAYLRGNFSLELINLQHADAGKYTCLISHSSEHSSVKLIVNESTTENETKSPKTEYGTKSADQGNEEAEQDATSSSLLWVYIGVPALLIALIACLIVIYRKKIKAAIFSPVTTEDKQQRQE
ncbi:CD276 antigen homolog [Labeo rohita]|uniref:CD276 antigen homolog n=1 Tax=Labeo rohita TaxID=84645 RepID=UPI0021E2B51D|nr:CD276 antigen homolog [Labeo rohita]